jgi:hypothetical protein
MRGDPGRTIQGIRDKTDMNQLASEVIARPSQVAFLVETLRHERSAIKFGCAKVLRLVSEQRPELIYPYFDFFVELMSSENSFLRWGAILTVANLVAVDAENRFDAVFSQYFANITGTQMVSATNAIGCSPVIARARPELTDRIVGEILKLEGAAYEHKGAISLECKNVVCGAAVKAFEALYPLANNKPAIARFVKEQTDNTRSKVRTHARGVIKRLGISP